MISRAWAGERLCDAGAVRGFLGLASGSRLSRRFEKNWTVSQRREDSCWLDFRLKGTASLASGQSAFKLYASPRPPALPALMEILSEELHRLGAVHFKVGATAASLLRPDKLVAYFGDVEALWRAGETLAARVTDLPAQGVPFTADVSRNGLLSWGLDPGDDERPVTWLQSESWRLWLTNRLARALVAAQRRPSDSVPAGRFALDRVRLEGIDVERWIPSSARWAAAVGA